MLLVKIYDWNKRMNGWDQTIGSVLKNARDHFLVSPVPKAAQLVAAILVPPATQVLLQLQSLMPGWPGMGQPKKAGRVDQIT